MLYKMHKQYIKQKEKHMTTIPDLGQAHKTCGGVKLVK